MPTFTTNYNLNKPNVNSADDEDLWGGQLNVNMDSIDTIMKANEDAAAAAAIANQLPVGSLYFNATDTTNPATLLGYGTWVSFGEGRVILGVGTGTDENAVSRTYAAGDSAGEYEHTLTIDEMPTHDHGYNQGLFDTQSGQNDAGNISTGENIRSSTTGGGQSHNNLQPYIAVYIWQRTA